MVIISQKLLAVQKHVGCVGEPQSEFNFWPTGNFWSNPKESTEMPLFPKTTVENAFNTNYQDTIASE